MASFFDRLGCYLLDVLLIFAISSVISVFIPNKGNDINKEITALTEKYTNGEVESEAFINEYQDLMYKYQKENYLSTVVSVGLNFIYFVAPSKYTAFTLYPFTISPTLIKSISCLLCFTILFIWKHTGRLYLLFIFTYTDSFTNLVAFPIPIQFLYHY